MAKIEIDEGTFKVQRIMKIRAALVIPTVLAAENNYSVNGKPKLLNKKIQFK